MCVLCVCACRLQQEISDLSGTVKTQKQQIQRYLIYQKFMETVLDVSPEVRIIIMGNKYNSKYVMV